MAFDAVKFLHILSVIFMSAPLYNLIVVNERVLFGKAPFAVDRYFENIIKGAAIRCYVFQLTALITGLILVPLSELPFSAVLTNPALLLKFILLIILSALLSLVHLRIQPAIDALLGRVEGEVIPKEVLEAVTPIRVRRKKLAGLCLFIVITIVLLGLQVFESFAFPVNILILALAALFSYRVYRSPVRFGWV
ncbi:MAG: hypothetical protein KAT46_04355 [Deltaproteobacteria bacterium]|nr:hypothetical protein [Deltaproteobacteria bacterium]